MVDVESTDFVVRESGQPREVLSVHIADYPIALLIDNSGAAQGDLEDIKATAVRFIHENRRSAGRRLDIWGQPAEVASFADDRQNPAGTGFAGSRVSPMLLLRPRCRPWRTPRAASAVWGRHFSSIVVLSAGGASPAGAPTALLAGILDSRRHGSRGRASAAATAVQRGGGDLQSLAGQTRGQFTSIFSSASFQVALDRLADQLASELMIDYIVQGNAPPKEDVTVGVKIPGARVVGMGVR
jgi:hypothetical protein